MPTLNITLRGMHCERCVDTIKASLVDLDGVVKCLVSLGLVDITYDEDAIRTGEILAAIRAAGPFEIDGFRKSD